MCDYNTESKKALVTLRVPPSQAVSVMTSRVRRPLVQLLRDGRARNGHDLHDGKPLPPRELCRGHYMSPANFERALDGMNRAPHRCQWCFAHLPTELTRRHALPHNHREEIAHHFHPECWTARLLAIAVIFGHIAPSNLYPPMPRRKVVSRPVGVARRNERRERTTLEIIVQHVRRIVITRRRRSRS